jgi:phenylalanyl-tRNA synthetase alpha chain
MDNTLEQALAQIEAIKELALFDLNLVTSTEQIESWRIEYLGRKDGKITNVMRSLPNLSKEDRPIMGAAANALKNTLESALNGLMNDIDNSENKNQTISTIDISLPGQVPVIGRLHPITQIVREICGIFESMGFQILEGPEVELDLYNFEMLNIPKGHPARDAWDTLWINYTDENYQTPMLMRTHTSPMQARIMENTEPPVRVIVPGKCYRYEATDATHEWHFHQIEGLAVDKDISFSNLKGTLYYLAQQIFGSERKIRFRCDYFPFVEPGVDMSIDCFICSNSRSGPQNDCRICRGTGWIEILGAGMVHPKVLENVGYDPNVYTGFAFGMGPERIAMLKYGIQDIRLFYENDMRFLSQF